MKVAVLVYHNDITKYKVSWTKKFVDSILNQTFYNYTIFELSYGGNNQSLFYSGVPYLEYYNRELTNHIEAMNFLIDRAKELDYDIIFNTNIDDYYSPDRFEKQIDKLKEGYDLVSSNFSYINAENEITNDMFMYKFKDDIKNQLNIGHNVIAHPVIATRASFWKDFRYDKTKLGYEDLDLWQRAINTKRFAILKDYLLYYRIHDKQITYGKS